MYESKFIISFIHVYIHGIVGYHDPMVAKMAGESSYSSPRGKPGFVFDRWVSDIHFNLISTRNHNNISVKYMTIHGNTESYIMIHDT